MSSEETKQEDPSPEVDITRALLFSGLKMEAGADLLELVRQELNTAFGCASEAVESATIEENQTDVLVVLSSRLNKNRIYTQRDRLTEPIKAQLLPPNLKASGTVNDAQPQEENAVQPPAGPQKSVAQKTTKQIRNAKRRYNRRIKLRAQKFANKAPSDDQADDFVVKDQVGEDEIVLDEKEILGDEEPINEENQPQKGIIEAEGGEGQVAESSDQHVDGEDQDTQDLEEHETDEHEENKGTETDEHKGTETKKIKEPQDTHRRKELESDWTGAPEFQWKRVMEPDERAKIVIENVSLSDFQNPWLYQTMMRARTFSFDCKNGTHKGIFEHNIFRRGRISMTFSTDTQAMAQCFNGLVFIRTPSNRRLKIFIPQTVGTMKMSHQLEKKMGKVMEPNIQSRQLMVRNIDPQLTPKDIEDRFGNDAKSITKAEIKNDGLGRPCALVTFSNPQTAIQSHINHDELKAGAGHGGRAYCKVFYMRDILPKPLMMKPEVKFNMSRIKYDEKPQKEEATEGAEPMEAGPDSGVKSPGKETDPKPSPKTGEDSSRKRPHSRSPGAEKPNKRPAIIYGGRGRGAPRGAGPQRGTDRPFRGSSRGRGEFRGGYGPRGRGRGEFGGRGSRGSRGGPGGRTNPWMDSHGPPMGSRNYGGGQSMSSLQAMINEQQRQLEMQTQLIQQQDRLSEMEAQLRRRKGPESSYGSASGGSLAGYRTMNPSMGGGGPMPQTDSYGSGRYGGGSSMSSGPVGRSYSPPRMYDRGSRYRSM